MQKLEQCVTLDTLHHFNFVILCLELSLLDDWREEILGCHFVLIQTKIDPVQDSH